MHHMAGVIPINYELMFEPLFHNFKFNGEEIITLNLSKPTNSIKIDAAELSIKESHIIQEENYFFRIISK